MRHKKRKLKGLHRSFNSSQTDYEDTIGHDVEVLPTKLKHMKQDFISEKEQLEEFAKKLIESQKDLEPEVKKILEDNLWDLV